MLGYHYEICVRLFYQIKKIHMYLINTFPAFSPRILRLSPCPLAIMLHFETGRVLIALLSWAQTHPQYPQLPFSACQRFRGMHPLQISCNGDIIIWTTFKMNRKEWAGLIVKQAPKVSQVNSIGGLYLFIFLEINPKPAQPWISTLQIYGLGWGGC